MLMMITLNNSIEKNNVTLKMCFVSKTKTIGDFGGPYLTTKIKISRGPNSIVAGKSGKIANIGSVSSSAQGKLLE